MQSDVQISQIGRSTRPIAKVRRPDGRKQTSISKQQLSRLNKRELTTREEPCFIPSGALERDALLRDVQHPYYEPEDACDGPPAGFRVYAYSSTNNPDEAVSAHSLTGRSHWALTKDGQLEKDNGRTVLQFRRVDGEPRLYVYDLDGDASLNGSDVPTSRYVELFNRDSIRTGSSEYLFVID